MFHQTGETKNRKNTARVKMTTKKKKQRLTRGMTETTMMTLMGRIRITVGRVMTMTNLQTTMEGMVLVVDKRAVETITVQTATLVVGEHGETILSKPTIPAKACLTHIKNIII